MIAVKRHPSRHNTYVDAVAAVHPSLRTEPWLYFSEGEYTRTFEGLIVPLKPETKPKPLYNPHPAFILEDENGQPIIEKRIDE
nr:MAG TPA: hypothetical protein [Caudoviricetes sp.]